MLKGYRRVRERNGYWIVLNSTFPIEASTLSRALRPSTQPKAAVLLLLPRFAGFAAASCPLGHACTRQITTPQIVCLVDTIAPKNIVPLQAAGKKRSVCDRWRQMRGCDRQDSQPRLQHHRSKEKRKEVSMITHKKGCARPLLQQGYWGPAQTTQGY